MEKNRATFEQIQKVSAQLQEERKNSLNSEIDEDRLHAKVKVQVSAILVPNVALFQYYMLPKNLEGNLELIMQLLSNNLEKLFDRMKPIEKTIPTIVEKEVQIPRIYDS